MPHLRTTQHCKTGEPPAVGGQSAAIIVWHSQLEQAVRTPNPLLARLEMTWPACLVQCLCLLLITRIRTVKIPHFCTAKTNRSRLNRVASVLSNQESNEWATGRSFFGSRWLCHRQQCRVKGNRSVATVWS